jgi:hypothetical protein
MLSRQFFANSLEVSKSVMTMATMKLLYKRSMSQRMKKMKLLERRWMQIGKQMMRLC